MFRFKLRRTTHRWLDEKGSVLPLVAISMVTLIGFTGLGLDVGMLYRHRRIMQTAADAGALAGASEIYRNQMGLVTNAALTGTAANQFADDVDGVTVTVNHPPSSGFYVGNSQYVEVLIRQPSPTYFMNIFGWTSVPVPARAVAGVGANNKNCIYVLDPTKARSLRFENDGSLTAGCGIMVNSNDPVAMKGENSANVQATSVSVTGGYVLQGATVTPTPFTQVPSEPDPLAYLERPSFGGCNYTNFKLDSGTTVVSPGVYCGGFKLEKNARAILNSGTYVINGGHFVLENTSTLEGSGVTFFLTNGAYITFENTTTVKLSAPTTGDYAGILFYQDPSSGSPSTIHRFENGTNSYYEGALYFPTQVLRLENVTNQQAAYTVVVARELEIENTASLQVAADYSGLPGGSPLKRISLVE